MARFLGQTDLRLVDPLDLTGLATAFDEAANHLRAAARALTSTEERSRAKSGAHPYSAVLPMHDGTDIYVENLTDRELQVLALLASGRTNAAIAALVGHVEDAHVCGKAIGSVIRDFKLFLHSDRTILPTLVDPRPLIERAVRIAQP